MASPEEIRDRILAFIAACKHRHPVLKDARSEVMPLEAGCFSVEARSGKVLLEAWNSSRSAVHRITGVRRETRDEMVLACQRFGAGQGQVRLLASSKRAADLQREAGRTLFAARFEKLLAQACAGWKLERISAERQLDRSFSSHTVRAVLRRGQEAWAVVGCAEEEGEPAAAAALTQGLAWLGWLRESKSAKRVFTGLRLFLPERFAQATALRWPFLNRGVAQFELYSFTPGDEVCRCEQVEFANLATELPPPALGAAATPEAIELLRRLAKHPAVELAPRAAPGPAPALTAGIHGLDFARAGPSGAVFGSDDDWKPLTPAALPDAERLADEIARFRAPDSPDRHHVFYTARPERWLESLLARDITVLSSELDAQHLYSQVPALVGRERGVIDLLAVTRVGRLVVIELKASPDPNLPLQALDYWIRVKWHLDRGEFRRLGYFAGRPLSADPPLLWLVAPLYEFHSLTDTVLGYLSPGIPIGRIGLNQAWRAGLQVVQRF